MNIKTLSPLIWLMLFINILPQNNEGPFEIAKSIAERIINDTSIELKQVIQKPQLDIQVIDFKKVFGENSRGISYALSALSCEEDKILKFGLSYSSPVKIWVNDNLVFENKNSSKFYFKEIAYTIFEFQDTLEIRLNKGKNKILVKTFSDGISNKIYLREISKAELPVRTKFVDPLEVINNNWVYTGNYYPENGRGMDEVFPPEVSIDKFYNYGNKIYTWQIPPPNILCEIEIKEDAVYKRESYAEWMYPNGTVLFGLNYMARSINDKTYSDFVKKVCDFTVSHSELFKKQYFEMDGFRSTNHRLYRMGMLDDASGPALPFIQLMLEKNGDEYEAILSSVLEYLSNGQSRLKDGTLCRPEPDKMTVWADDLFMSVPFLVRAAKIYNEKKYYDDAARQIINFNKYLFDTTMNLYKHAWFDYSKEKSVAFWGRANGWVIWATTEALLNIPKAHKDYKTIKKIFSRHIDGLIKVQNEDGMWHQVLDRKDSFKETSCTAMFIIGLTRGIKNGWISKSYEKNLLSAWNALKQRITSEGIVKDITRGTGVGFDLEFYFSRQRFDNDPRGLGAVITAATEIGKYLGNK
ncbi:MAG: glycoside hydrolase family 88 protein [Melioribacteraceae bacterium]|nr:glycoside hydrolase family 88 protein [Melioribacteraceae bacterium]